jgi:hypothetical protein
MVLVFGLSFSQNCRAWKFYPIDNLGNIKMYLYDQCYRLFRGLMTDVMQWIETGIIEGFVNLCTITRYNIDRSHYLIKILNGVCRFRILSESNLYQSRIISCLHFLVSYSIFHLINICYTERRVAARSVTLVMSLQVNSYNCFAKNTKTRKWAFHWYYYIVFLR